MNPTNPVPEDGRHHYVKSYGWSKRSGEPMPSVSALTACGKSSAVQLQHGRVTFFAETTNCPHCQHKLTFHKTILAKESENV